MCSLVRGYLLGWFVQHICRLKDCKQWKVNGNPSRENSLSLCLSHSFTFLLSYRTSIFLFICSFVIPIFFSHVAISMHVYNMFIYQSDVMIMEKRSQARNMTWIENNCTNSLRISLWNVVVYALLCAQLRVNRMQKHWQRKISVFPLNKFLSHCMLLLSIPMIYVQRANVWWCFVYFAFYCLTWIFANIFAHTLTRRWKNIHRANFELASENSNRLKRLSAETTQFIC